MIVLGLDPGSAESALVEWDTIRKRIGYRAKLDNRLVPAALADRADCNVLVQESTTGYMLPASRGAPFIPQQVLDTVEWSGYFRRVWADELGGTFARIDRRRVKLALLGRVAGTDAHVRAAMLELVGPQGTKKAPGPTFGMRADLWAALAVAYVWHQNHVAALAAAARATIPPTAESAPGGADDRPF